MNAEEIRNKYRKLTVPGTLKGESEEAERLKIEVMAEVAAQLAQLNENLAFVVNFAVDELRKSLGDVSSALYKSSSK